MRATGFCAVKDVAAMTHAAASPHIRSRFCMKWVNIVFMSILGELEELASPDMRVPVG
jgi:hypothetical protein